MQPLSRQGDVLKALAVVKRGCVECHTDEDLKRKLTLRHPLRIKLGVDPTSADLHLGHTVILNRLRAFQDLGHTAVLIIGDFTARVGDPSGRDSTRPTLSPEQIKENAATYQEQAFKVLDSSKTELRFNSEWLDPFMRESIFEVLRRCTVGQLLQREDFALRQSKGLPISMLEILYPILQGYDSVATQADVELGGTDQLFNLLMGRQMQKDFNQEPQVALTFPLLVGLDGVKKMSKSYGNAVSIAVSKEQGGARTMFGQIMSLSDKMMLTYYELLTQEDMIKVRAQHPLEAKKTLARTLVARFYDGKTADEELKFFVNTFSKKELPKEIRTENAQRDDGSKKWIFQTKDAQQQWEAFSWSQLLVKLKLSDSRKEAQRLILQGGLKINGETVRDDYITEDYMRIGAYTLQVGRHKFLKINLS